MVDPGSASVLSSASIEPSKSVQSSRERGRNGRGGIRFAPAGRQFRNCFRSRDLLLHRLPRLATTEGQLKRRLSVTSDRPGCNA